MAYIAPVETTTTKTLALRGMSMEQANGNVQPKSDATVTSTNESILPPPVFKPYGYSNLKYGAFYAQPWLSLSAVGECPPDDYCYGFQWVPQFSYPERLSYRLYCYHTYYGNGRRNPIRFSEQFKFPTLSGVAQDGMVLLDGQLTRINWVGPIPPPISSNASTIQAKSVNAAPATAAPDAVQTEEETNYILAYVGEPFKISQSKEISQRGSISIVRDKSALNLIDAEIADKNIVWTLVGQRIANTTATVVIKGGILPYIREVNYHITLVSKEPALTASLPSINMVIPSFTDLLRMAQTIVEQSYSDVNFLKSRASHSGGTLIVDNPRELNIITALFSTSSGVVRTTEVGEGLWSKPELTSPIVGIQSFDLKEINVDLYDLSENGVREWLDHNGYPIHEWGYIDATLYKVLGAPGTPDHAVYDVYMQQSMGLGKIVNVQVPASEIRIQGEVGAAA